ncbi:MAG TPA: glucoamylase family protein, partial [Acidimicrobiia bacterium]|nr:glucoamylase family protein [Acidimicrobiia bacterium]
LFIHQLPHLWIDFRDIQDDFMAEREIDYFENSRRATYLQQRYAIDNPLEYPRYDEWCWGMTASDGPGPATLTIDGRKRRFFDYLARGAPGGPDDGTLAPWSVVTSLPFAPEIVVPTLRYFAEDVRLEEKDAYGLRATFNACFPTKDETHPFGWVSPWNYGLNQGPIVMMIENARTGLIWDLMRACPYLVGGLRRAGFRGGWLA